MRERKPCFAALEWAEHRLAEGHHFRCDSNHGRECNCYFRGGAYLAARALLDLRGVYDAAAELADYYEGRSCHVTVRNVVRAIREAELPVFPPRSQAEEAR